jgi:hypothetical protein
MMSMQTTVPIRMDAVAAKHVEQLQRRHELEAMLDYVRETATGLRQIEVTLEYDPCEERPPVVTIWARRNLSASTDDPTNRTWADWFANTFPPEVCEQFVLLSCYESGHGR